MTERPIRPWPTVWIGLPGGLAHAAERLGEPLPGWLPVSLCARQGRHVPLSPAVGYRRVGPSVRRCNPCALAVRRRQAPTQERREDGR